MTQRCEQCNRRLTNAESRSLGIGPTCLERMRDRGLVVGGKPRTVAKPRARLMRGRSPAAHEAQMALEFA
jgi:hypothetical protein